MKDLDLVVINSTHPSAPQNQAEHTESHVDIESGLSLARQAIDCR